MMRTGSGRYKYVKLGQLGWLARLDVQVVGYLRRKRRKPYCDDRFDRCHTLEAVFLTPVAMSVLGRENMFYVRTCWEKLRLRSKFFDAHVIVRVEMTAHVPPSIENTEYESST